MGAGDWVSGGLRRAVSGVRSAMPGQGDLEPDVQEPAAPVAADSVVTEREAAVENAPVEMVPAEDVPAEKAPATPAPSTPAPSPKATAKKGPATRSHAEPTTDVAPARPPHTWTDEELAGFRVALETDIIRLREELHMGDVDMADLIADSSDGAGDDQADAGSKTLEREQEMSVNANARDLLDQSTHALLRLDAGTYGICESCGNVIPAARLRAFPRATLCISCKQAEERR